MLALSPHVFSFCSPRGEGSHPTLLVCSSVPWCCLLSLSLPPVHLAVLSTSPTPAFSLSSSPSWLPKPSLTQHSKLRDKQRQGHTDGGEGTVPHSQHNEESTDRGEEAEPSPLSPGEGATTREGNTKEQRSRQEGWGVSLHLWDCRKRTHGGERASTQGERPSSSQL